MSAPAQIGPGVAITTDGELAFSESLGRYITELNLSMKDGLRKQFGLLLAKNLIPLTPPKGKIQGEKTVKRDVNRAVRVLRPKDFKSKKIRQMIRKRDYQGLQILFGRLKGLSDLAKAEFGPFDERMHQGQRTKRGAVSEKRYVHFATADEDKVRAYIKERQGWVGQAKGGWAKAARALGHTPGGWITRHERFGEFTDTLDNLGGYIRAVNRSAWAKSGEDERRVETALASRARAIDADLRRRALRAQHKEKLT